MEKKTHFLYFVLTPSTLFKPIQRLKIGQILRTMLVSPKKIESAYLIALNTTVSLLWLALTGAMELINEIASSNDSILSVKVNLYAIAFLSTRTLTP